MVVSIRPATVEDVPDMVALSDQHRLLLQQYQPVFWRKADNSQEMQIPYFEKLIADEAGIILIAEANRSIEGFIIAMPIPVPPVYNPDGNTYLIDDFCVRHIHSWATIGSILLKTAIQHIKARDVTQIVVVCPHLFEEKRSLLQSEGLAIASEWYVRQI
jgi:hypothetical protein